MRKGYMRVRLGGSLWVGVCALATVALVVVPLEGAAAAGDDPPGTAEDVTFARDVMPILQENCQSCHNPQGMGPMSLMSYEEVRPWAPLVKDRVQARRMPPWHIDRTVGIQEFKNDVSLSDEEIQTIVQWVDAGAPLGDPADMPPPVQLADQKEWNLERQLGRAPDLIIRSTPYTIEASGLDQWWTPVVDVTEADLPEPRWVMANETKPAYPLGWRVVHHANTAIERDGESNGFSNYGVGKPYDFYPDHTGRFIKAGDQVSFNLHYYPIGERVVDDVVEIGLWFYPEGAEPPLETLGDESFSSYRQVEGRATQELVIAPHSKAITQASHVLETPARIHSCRGHMHLLGEAQQLEAIYPDGRHEVLCRVLWDHNWHVTYLFEDHVQPMLPTGTVLLVTSWYDNTVNKPANPDPDQWVVHGRRTVDEMSHMWIGITRLNEDEFRWLVTEREQLLSQRALEEMAAAGREEE